MSSDIPGFYFDPVHQRYYRISSQTSNSLPSARLINERARQEQLVSKQLDILNPATSRRSSRVQRAKRKLLHPRLSLLRQRQYGQISTGHCHSYLRSNLIESLPTTCFLDELYSFSPAEQTVTNGNYAMILTSAGQCFQFVDYQFQLNRIDQPQYSYRLQPNDVDGARSSYFIESSPSLMTTTLLNDENHAIVRFLQFSSSARGDHWRPMVSNHPSAPEYFYEEKEQTIRFASSSTTHHSPLLIKCAGPCCYAPPMDRFAFNINNDVYIYDLNNFQLVHSLRVPIRRVTLSDMKFSMESSDLVYTTNGHQFQQWDLRQSPGTRSLRIPILCSTIRCLRTQPNRLLVSSYDERINLIDLRSPTRPVLVYDTANGASNNPHFSFAIDDMTEYFLAACSQYHITYVWDLQSGRLLNRFRCPIPVQWVHTATQCSIACVDQQPVLGIYHPDYCRLTSPMKN